MGGMFGAIGVLAALRERERTGRGQEVQSALFENCVFLSAQNMQQHLMTGEPVPPMPSRVSSWSVYDVFTLKDDEQLFIGAVSDRQFLILCRVLEAPELAADPALATNEKRVAVRPELLKKLAEILRHHDVAELVPKLEAAGLPYAPIVKPEQLVHDRHLKESGGLVPMQTEDGGTTDVVLLPITLGGRRPGVRLPLPRIGEHTDEILASLPGRRAGAERGDGAPHRKHAMALYRIDDKAPQVAASAYVAAEATLIGAVSVGERATRPGRRGGARRQRADHASAPRATSRKARSCTPTRASR